MKKSYLYIFMLILVSLSHFYLYKSAVVENFDLQIYDLSTSFLEMNADKENSSVVVVDIDEKSLQVIGQWPWPRVILAQLINKISASQPSAIGLDILFPEKDRTSPIEIENFYKRYFHVDLIIEGLNKKYFNNDLILADVIHNTQSVLSYYLSDTQLTNNKCTNTFTVPNTSDFLQLNRYPYLMCNSSIIQNASSVQGFVNKYVDIDGVLRKIPLLAQKGDKTLPSLALATLLSIDDNVGYDKDTMEVLGHRIDTSRDSSVLLNYYSNKGYKKLSAVDLLQTSEAKKFLQGKIVLLGSSAIALHDRVIIPHSREIAGVLVNATVIGNILDNSLISQPNRYKIYNLILSFFFSVLLAIILFKENRVWIVVLFVIVLVTSVLINLFELSAGVYISLGYLLIPFLVFYFIINLLSIVIDVIEKKVFLEELNQSQIALFDSMVHVAEVHDTETGEHIVRTKKYVKLLAQSIYEKGLYKDYLNLKKIEMIYQTSALHDIGKVGITDLILKKQGKLTEAEFQVMKTHSKLGKNIIDNAISSYKENEFFITARNIAYCHHEKYDGSGYPKALVGAEIPLEARIMALADVYDALMSKRVYKEAFPYEKTKNIILDGRFKHFDPIVIDAFLDKEEEFKIISQVYANKKGV